MGVAIVALVPWKQIAVRRGLRRRRPDVVVSVLLGVAVIVALATGFAHSTGLLRTTPVVSAMQVHVGAALVALVPFGWHALRRRQRARVTDLSRRNLLLGAGVVAGAGVAYAALGGLGALLGLPGAERRGTGSFDRGSGDPSALPATIWLFDRVPDIDPDAWTVAVTSGGDTRRWSLADLPAPSVERDVLLDCTSGWYSTQRWSGVPLAALLPDGATGAVEVRSATGYRRLLPLTDDLLLATTLGGRPLDAGHGAPVRLVVPGRRGFHWVKWVVAVEHHPDRPWWVQLPLPLG
ncbi:molybdopterin-dependent oxidoreductase [Jatrophihabitans sp. YIM 134969]